MATNDPGNIHPNDLEAFCVAALCKAGLSADDAALTAKVFVTTDTWGTFTHGTRQIRVLRRSMPLVRQGDMGSQSPIH